MAVQKGKAAREEREKNQHLKENARLELLLHKELGSKDLSVIAKKLGATSKVAKPQRVCNDDCHSTSVYRFYHWL